MYRIDACRALAAACLIFVQSIHSPVSCTDLASSSGRVAWSALSADEFGSTVVRITSSPIFDLTSHRVISDGSGELTLDQVHSPEGKLTGYSRDVRGGDFESELFLSGSTKGARGVVQVRSKARSYISIGGEVQSEAVQSSRGVIDSTGNYRGVLATRACDPEFGCHTVTNSFDLQLGSGAWELKLTLDGEGNRVFGPVTLTTSVNHPARKRQFDYVASGKYSARTGVATLRLIPVEGSGGLPLRIKARMTPTTTGEPWVLDGLTEIKGKLFGQKILVKE